MITIAVLVITVIAAVFFTVFLLAKQKKIFINKWFVKEEKSTIGVDVSSYQEDIDMSELKAQNIQFIYIKASEGSKMKDRRFVENWENAKTKGCRQAHIISFLMTVMGSHRQKISLMQ